MRSYVLIYQALFLDRHGKDQLQSKTPIVLDLHHSDVRVFSEILEDGVIPTQNTRPVVGLAFVPQTHTDPLPTDEPKSWRFSCVGFKVSSAATNYRVFSCCVVLELMNYRAHRRKHRQDGLTALDVAIETLNLAEQASSITPAKAIFALAGVILTTVRVGVPSARVWIAG